MTWPPRPPGRSHTGPICLKCQTIHGADEVVAVGKFDPAGIHGYRLRIGGPLRATRAEAHADLCAARTPTPPPRCECGLTDPEMPCLDCRFQIGGAA